MSLKKVFPLLFLLTLMLSGSAFAERGTVVYYNNVNKCVVVSVFHGYSYGKVQKFYAKPYRLEPGDVLEGTSFQFGTRRLTNLSNDREIEIFFKVGWASKEEARKWVEEQEEKDSLW